VSVLRQQLAPEVYVAVLHRGELTIDVGLSRVSLRLRQFAIEEGGVGFIFQMMEPSVGGCRRGGGHVRMITA
jgi:hypothetical protein